MDERIPVVFDSYDERFAGGHGDDYFERLFSGGRWTEGPVYVPSGKYLLFSDIPNNRVLRWDETDGSVSVFRSPSNYTNGHTLDRHGRLISCEQGGRRVTRTEIDGSITVLAERWNGHRLNSPNDAVVASDGSVWFTDPPYGITSDYEGERAEPEIDGCHVYRVDPVSGAVDIVADDFERPNGLAFSPDESLMYIVDTRRNHIRRFRVEPEGKLSGGEVFAECPEGQFDGIRLDETGRIWAACADVHCFDPDGTHLARLRIPEPNVSNLVFGGRKRNRLFVTATGSVYSVLLNINGAAKLPRD
ncbi:SMP-30/gluconolactonase/LRE family protein [Stackebrandtia nassauensis]|uniref:Gluconolactonase n=1 Tax=Stackebrandtia nassauensis (strain DSM 44728 / CIP 108903 / NRRL B-16338 / NBRC 102104 / LLR-40K-21) TaxID=446470 RepID=D3Q6N1_STANL|nr:SMP-30/gluconolactonase/LRE family protein [Stackebrandtia nassauensis]ADD44274.1 Gluconolactonase [Stackebrandtia nassauensis DSM 44728]